MRQQQTAETLGEFYMAKSPKPPKKHHPNRPQKEKIASPYGTGFDKVERVVDTITAMHRRRQLDDREAQAANRYRDAHQLVGGGLTGTLDPSKSFGSTPGGKIPSSDQLWAAETLSEASRWLGRIDGFVVRAICGEGLSVTSAAKLLYGRTSRRTCEQVGCRLREGLAVMADGWQLRNARPRIRASKPAPPSGEKQGESTVLRVIIRQSAYISEKS